MTDDLPEDFVAIKNMGLNAVRVPTSGRLWKPWRAASWMVVELVGTSPSNLPMLTWFQRLRA